MFNPYIKLEFIEKNDNLEDSSEDKKIFIEKWNEKLRKDEYFNINFDTKSNIYELKK